MAEPWSKWSVDKPCGSWKINDDGSWEPADDATRVRYGVQVDTSTPTDGEEVKGDG